MFQPPYELPALYSSPDENLERHAPFLWRNRYGVVDAMSLMRVLHERVDSTTVVVVDMRMSTRVFKETAVASTYWREVANFMSLASVTVRAFGGWWDKFTGDGFIAYWLHGEGLGGGLDPVDGQPSPTVAAALTACSAIRDLFGAHLYKRLVGLSSNWPSEAGLCFGLDTGLTDALVVADDLTVLGDPVIGAHRMASVARRWEMIANSRLASALATQVERGIWGPATRPWLSVGVRTEFTKEFPESVGGINVSPIAIVDGDAVLEVSHEGTEADGNPLLKASLTKLRRESDEMRNHYGGIHPQG